MMNYTEKQFTEVLSEFILSSEDTYEVRKKNYADFFEVQYKSVENCLLNKISGMITDKIDGKEYGINNAVAVNIGIAKYKPSICGNIQMVMISKTYINILETIRLAKSWEDVMSVYDEFIFLFEKECQTEFCKNVRSTNDEGLFYLLFTMFLALGPIYALNDSMYDQLAVNKKGNSRLKFDYLKNGLPFGTIPYIYEEKSDVNISDKEKTIYLFDDLVKIENEYIKNNELSDNTISDFRYFTLLFNTCQYEFNFKYIPRDKFKRTVYRYIDTLESSLLAFVGKYIEFDYDDYNRANEFNKQYSEEINKSQSIEEIEQMLEKYNELYTTEVTGLRTTYVDYAQEALLCKKYFTLGQLVDTKSLSMHMTKQECLVINSHLNKLFSMLLNFVKENIDEILPLITCYFNITENAVFDIKEKLKESGQQSISAKVINKKIAKFKKLFNYKELNKLANEAGFSLVRCNGDHGIFKKLDGTVVVIPQGRNIGKGLSMKIQSDIINSYN